MFARLPCTCNTCFFAILVIVLWFSLFSRGYVHAKAVFQDQLPDSVKYSGNITGPSFNCDKAITKVELSICGSERLSSIDYELNQIYTAKLSNPKIRAEVRSSQVFWLNNERSECEKVNRINREACIRSAYLNQIKRLVRIEEESNSQGELHGRSEDKIVVNDSRVQDIEGKSVFYLPDFLNESSISVVSKRGELKVLYKSSDEKYASFSLSEFSLEKYNSKDDYPVHSRIVPVTEAALKDGGAIALDYFRSMPNSLCPRDLNSFVKLRGPDGQVDSEFVILFKLPNPIHRDVRNCPNAIGSFSYTTSLISIGAGFVRDESTGIIYLVSRDGVGDEPGLLVQVDSGFPVSELCSDNKIVLVEKQLIRKLFSGDEIDYSVAFSRLNNIAQFKQEELCR